MSHFQIKNEIYSHDYRLSDWSISKYLLLTIQCETRKFAKKMYVYSKTVTIKVLDSMPRMQSRPVVSLC